MDEAEDLARRKQLALTADWLAEDTLILEGGFNGGCAYVRHKTPGLTCYALEILGYWQGGAWGPPDDRSQQDPHPPF